MPDLADILGFETPVVDFLPTKDQRLLELLQYKTGHSAPFLERFQCP